MPIGVANAAVNAAGKLLKVVELQVRYGKPNVRGTKTLVLCDEPPAEEVDARDVEIVALKQKLAELEHDKNNRRKSRNGSEG